MRDVCLHCLNKLKYRFVDGEYVLQPCDHDLSFLNGIDWTQVRADAIAAAHQKLCPTCGLDKSVTAFYKNASKPDGRSTECAECSRQRAKDRQKEPRVKQVRQEWRKGETGQAMVKRRVRDPLYKVKKAAHRKVERAVASGTLVIPPQCEDCPSTGPLEGHHDDYSKPLDVRWLCVDCHNEWHRENDAVCEPQPGP